MMRLTVFRQPQQAHREAPWLLAAVWACVKSLPTVQHALDSFHTSMLLVVRPLEARVHMHIPCLFICICLASNWKLWHTKLLFSVSCCSSPSPPPPLSISPNYSLPAVEKEQTNHARYWPPFITWVMSLAQKSSCVLTGFCVWPIPAYGWAHW